MALESATDCLHINKTLSAIRLDSCPAGDILASSSSYGLLRFSGVMIVFIIVLGVLGNALTIAALIKCPKIRNLTMAFITSLCVADMCFCVLVMPFTAYRFLNDCNYFGPDDVLCVVYPLVQYANVGVSLLSIAMITVNRFVMIAHPEKYKWIYTQKTVALMVIFSWVAAFAILIPTLTGHYGSFGYDCLGSCSVKGGAKTTLFLLGFLTPCVIIIICYAGIFWTVHRSKSRMLAHSGSTSGNGAPVRSGSDWRLTKMILIIFLSFLVCYLPLSIIKVVDKQANHPNFHLIGYVLIYCSACINPIIYFTMNRQYRQAYKSVLFWCFDSQESSPLSKLNIRRKTNNTRTNRANSSNVSATSPITVEISLHPQFSTLGKDEVR